MYNTDQGQLEKGPKKWPAGGMFSLHLGRPDAMSGPELWKPRVPRSLPITTWAPRVAAKQAALEGASFRNSTCI